MTNYTNKSQLLLSSLGCEKTRGHERKRGGVASVISVRDGERIVASPPSSSQTRREEEEEGEKTRGCERIKQSVRRLVVSRVNVWSSHSLLRKTTIKIPKT